jgi:hypothetical protein
MPYRTSRSAFTCSVPLTGLESQGDSGPLDMNDVSAIPLFRRSCSRLDSAPPLLPGCLHRRTGCFVAFCCYADNNNVLAAAWDRSQVGARSAYCVNKEHFLLNISHKSERGHCCRKIGECHGRCAGIVLLWINRSMLSSVTQTALPHFTKSRFFLPMNHALNVDVFRPNRFAASTRRHSLLRSRC